MRESCPLAGDGVLAVASFEPSSKQRERPGPFVSSPHALTAAAAAAIVPSRLAGFSPAAGLAVSVSSAAIPPLVDARPGGLLVASDIAWPARGRAASAAREAPSSRA